MRLGQVPCQLVDRLGSAGLIGPDRRFSFNARLRSKAAGLGQFACSEICKGVVIIWVGDFATADAVAEAISFASYPPAAFTAILMT